MVTLEALINAKVLRVLIRMHTQLKGYLHVPLIQMPKSQARKTFAVSQIQRDIAFVHYMNVLDIQNVQ